MKSRIVTFFVTLLIAAVPLGLLWEENASLRARIAAQSLNRAASSDTEALKLLKAAGLTDREISKANLLPAVVDRITPKQARGTITRSAMVRPD